MKASGVKLSFDGVVDRGVSGKSTCKETTCKWMNSARLDNGLTSTVFCKADIEANPRSNTNPQCFVVKWSPNLSDW